jgi:N6-adenosine-specific RNA methylase IME4
MTCRRIDEIIVGIRHRKNLGDIAGLAESIRGEGLLHPIVIRPDGRLIAGKRRLEACKQLGWTDVPVNVVDLAEIVRGELAENAHRKDFLPSEIEAIRRAMEPIEKASAKERQGARNDLRETFPEVREQRARDRIGTFAGVSGRTIEKIRDLVEAAKAEPDKFGKLVEDMDRTGRVDGPHKRLKIIKQSEAIRRELPPLPHRGPYRVIVADPPWPYERRKEDPSHRGTLPYPPMSIAQLSALPVSSIAHDDCLLWLWTTNHHMREAFAVLDAWGFQQKTILTWTKDKMGMGDWLRGQTEHCLMAVRGKPIVHLTNQTTALSAPVRAHSQKPDEFYELVEKLCPAPRCSPAARTSAGTVTATRCFTAQPTTSRNLSTSPMRPCGSASLTAVRDGHRRVLSNLTACRTSSGESGRRRWDDPLLRRFLA